MFAATEAKRYVSYVTGFKGNDKAERDAGSCGPGNFKAAFSPHHNSFDGLGTEASGRRWVASIAI